MWIATALVAAVAALGIFFYSVFSIRICYLDIKNSKGQHLASLALSDGTFEHVFIHSIHLTPVEERFTLERKANDGVVLRLYELRYQSSGVGMPSDEENGYRLENGVFILSMHREFSEIPVMISIVEGHGVKVDGVLYPFLAWADKEELLVLSGRITKQIQLKRWLYARFER